MLLRGRHSPRCQGFAFSLPDAGVSAGTETILPNRVETAMPRLADVDMTSDSPPAGLTPPQRALWWLKKGGLRTGREWDIAHAICQTREGHSHYDVVHALTHWIEGDAPNAAYWYRRAGGERATDIAADWTRISTLLDAAEPSGTR